MKLRLGRMTTEEMANWFGVTVTTYYSRRKKRMEELKEYCDFEEYIGGLIIKEIYKDTYEKKVVKKEEKKKKEKKKKKKKKKVHPLDRSSWLNYI